MLIFPKSLLNQQFCNQSPMFQWCKHNQLSGFQLRKLRLLTLFYFRKKSFFLNHRKLFNLKSGETETEHFRQIILSTQMNSARSFFGEDAQMFVTFAFQFAEWFKCAVQVWEAESAFFKGSLRCEKIEPAPWFDLFSPDPAFFEDPLKISIGQAQWNIQLLGQLPLIYVRAALNCIKLNRVSVRCSSGVNFTKISNRVTGCSASNMFKHWTW